MNDMPNRSVAGANVARMKLKSACWKTLDFSAYTVAFSPGLLLLQNTRNDTKKHDDNKTPTTTSSSSANVRADYFPDCVDRSKARPHKISRIIQHDDTVFADATTSTTARPEEIPSSMHTESSASSVFSSSSVSRAVFAGGEENDSDDKNKMDEDNDCKNVKDSVHHRLANTRASNKRSAISTTASASPFMVPSRESCSRSEKCKSLLQEEQGRFITKEDETRSFSRFLKSSLAILLLRKGSPRTPDQEGPRIKVPHDHDVLCCATNEAMSHEGNLFFRMVCCDGKFLRENPSGDIVTIVDRISDMLLRRSPPARVLVMDMKRGGNFVELNRGRLRKKIGSAIYRSRPPSRNTIQRLLERAQTSSPKNIVLHACETPTDRCRSSGEETESSDDIFMHQVEWKAGCEAIDDSSSAARPLTCQSTLATGVSSQSPSMKAAHTLMPATCTLVNGRRHTQAKVIQDHSLCMFLKQAIQTLIDRPGPRRRPDQQGFCVQVPHEHDAVLGSNKGAGQHVGNQFLNMLCCHGRLVRLESPDDLLPDAIVDIMEMFTRRKPTGRFLELDLERGGLVDVSYDYKHRSIAKKLLDTRSRPKRAIYERLLANVPTTETIVEAKDKHGCKSSFKICRTVESLDVDLTSQATIGDIAENSRVKSKPVATYEAASQDVCMSGEPFRSVRATSGSSLASPSTISIRVTREHGNEPPSFQEDLGPILTPTKASPLNLDQPYLKYFAEAVNRLMDRPGRPRTPDQEGTVIPVPHEHDVLLQCGTWARLHMGNRVFIMVCDYAQCVRKSSRDDKPMDFPNLVVDTLMRRKPRGLFLAWDAMKGGLVELSPKELRTKICRTLLRKRKKPSRGSIATFLESDALTRGGYFALTTDGIRVPIRISMIVKPLKEL